MAKKRIYRTNKGKQIDMEAMRIANAKTIAAGNMSVNAKGDIVQGGKIVKTAKERVAPSYQKTTQVKNVSLKKPLTKEDRKVTPPEPEPLPEMDTSQMTTSTVKTREDGSQYRETMTPEGDISIEELSAPAKKTTKKKSTRKKAKASKKKPLA